MNVKLLKIPLPFLTISVLSIVIAIIAAPGRRASVEPVVKAKEEVEEAKPLFVLVEYNHRAMVVGADTPTFALYDDGTVIFWRKEGRGGKYVSAKLTDSEVSGVLEQVNPQSFVSLGRRYEPAGGISHAPETLMVLREKGGSYKGVYIFGSLRREENGSYPRGVPNLLADVFQFATTYDNAKATEWLPDSVEVMVWPYEYAPDKDLV